MVTLISKTCVFSPLSRFIFVNCNVINRQSFVSLVGKAVREPPVQLTWFGRLRFGSGLDRLQKLKPYELDTRVPKDVLLFKHDNGAFFRIVNFFAVSQVIFWGYLAHFSYTTLRDVPQEEIKEEPVPTVEDSPVSSSSKSSWWQNVNLGANKYRLGITLLCCTIGYIILTGTTIFTMRSVKSLTLLQGGQTVNLVCYSPWWSSRVLTVPLDNLSCNVAREHTKAYLPIKIKGYWMYFLLDKSGSFPNTKLFDHTAGSYRTWVQKK